MKLRAQVKAKSDVEEQKAKLEQELIQVKQKASDQTKKATRAVE